MEKNKTDKTKMIEDLQERLNWFVNEASEDEYNEEEVKAIKNLLDVMAPQEPNDLDESYYNPEMAFERFKATLDIRMRIQDEMRRFLAGEVTLADYPDDDDALLDDDAEDDSTGSLSRGNIGTDDATLIGKDSAKDKAVKVRTKPFFRSRGMYRGVMAAALVLALLVGGTVGAYAQKNGFFQWVKRDKEGMSVMTSPDGLENNVEGNKYFYSLSEVPEEYREYIWEPDQVPQGMKFVHYGIMRYKDWDRVLGLYKNNEQELRVEYISRIFAKGIEYHSQQYDSYDFLYTKEYNGVTFELFQKNNDDKTEYAASFLYNNVQYIVQGNLALSDIELLASDFYCGILK